MEQTGYTYSAVVVFDVNCAANNSLLLHCCTTSPSDESSVEV